MKITRQAAESGMFLIRWAGGCYGKVESLENIFASWSLLPERFKDFGINFQILDIFAKVEILLKLFQLNFEGLSLQKIFFFIKLRSKNFFVFHKR